MIRRRKYILMCLFFMVGMITRAEIVEGTCGNNMNWTFDTETGKLAITGSGAMTDFSYYTNVPWYNYRESIESIELGDQITSIGKYAFYSCSKFTNLVIPNSVTAIGANAFSECSSMETVVLPNAITALNYATFAGCSNLISIEIPNSVTWIGESIFSGCINLTKVELPQRINSIGNSMFNSCVKLESILIPKDVKSIGNNAFAYCWSLHSIELGNSVTSIGDNAFAYCGSLHSIELGNSVKSIGKNVFEGCDSLTSISFPNSVENISNDAFKGCVNLESITIGNSQMSIGFNAFSECERIAKICLLSNNPPYIGSAAEYYDGKTSCFAADVLKYAYLHIPQGSYEAYSSAYGWREFTRFKEDLDSEGNTYYYSLKVKQGNKGFVEHAVKADEEYVISFDERQIADVVSAKFNGEDIKAKIVNGKFRTPAIIRNSELEVIFAQDLQEDVNGDGAIDVSDITATASIILNNAKQEQELEADE